MITPILTWPSVYTKITNYGHVVRVLHSPLSRVFLRYYPLSPHPPHLELKRSEISSLPRARFRGRKIVIPRAAFKVKGQNIIIASCEDIESHHRDHIRKLAANAVLGFDTEQNPTFVRGQTPAWPCLVQLASEELCIMWRLGQHAVRRRKLPPLLHDILTSEEVLKVGCGSKDDALLLLKHFHVNTRHFFDTLDLATDLQLPMPGLQGTVAVLLGYNLRKSSRVQLSKWNRKVLSQQQVDYASTDAWASLLVYQKLMQYAARTGVTPQPPVKQAYELVGKKQAQQAGSSHAPCGSVSSPTPCGGAPGSSPTPCGDTPGSSPTPCGDTPGSSPTPCGNTPGSSPTPCGNTPGSSPTPCGDTPGPSPTSPCGNITEHQGNEVGALCTGGGSCSI